ncbi:MAG: substrate-binding domain-containing protein [Christensenellaceae bacterium]|jgi:ribose transport system substrate-binding protein
MKINKMITVILSIALLVVFTVACSATAAPAESASAESASAESAPTESASEEAAASEDAPAEAESRKFGVTFMTLDNVHWLRMEKGITDNLRGDDELIVTNAAMDSSMQLSQVEDLIAQECDAIFIIPVDGAAIRAGFESCIDAGIPAIAIDVGPDERELATTYVATDNYLAGQLMGEGLIRDRDGSAVVGLLGCDIIMSCRNRAQGFLDAIENSPDIEVIIRQDAAVTTEDALPVLENMLQACPEITDFVCVNDLQAFAAIRVAQASNRPDIGVYGVDGNPDAVEYILEGEMSGTSAQYPEEMGRIALEKAYEILEGKTVEDEYPVDAKWIDKDNGQEYLDGLADLL